MINDKENSCNNIQNPFMIKTLNKLAKEGNNLYPIKAMYGKPIVNIILNGERPKVFLSDWEQDKDAHFHNFHLTQYWKYQLGQGGKKKGRDIQSRKREVKLSLFTDDIILYVENRRVP